MNPTEPKQPVAPRSEDDSEMSGRRVLIIDDDARGRMTTAHMLQSRGAITETFADGISSVGWCAQRPGTVVDALVLDLRMPLMSAAITRSALLQVLAPQRPVTLATSTALLDADGTQERREAMHQGFDGFLPQPLHWPSMQRLLQPLLAAKTAPPGSRSRVDRPDSERHPHEALWRNVSRLLADGQPSLEDGAHGAEAALRRLLQRAREAATREAHPSAGMCRLVYQSRYRMSKEQAMTLLAQCQANNVRNGITGLLIHDGERVIQAIEGPPATIDVLFGHIQRDRRHAGIQVIELAIDQPRLFGAWSMASVSLDAQHFELLRSHLTRRAAEPAFEA